MSTLTLVVLLICKQSYVCSQNVADYYHFDDGSNSSPSKCRLHDNTERFHAEEVQRAEKEALAKARAENPALTEEDLRVKVSESVKIEEQERIKRAEVVEARLYYPQRAAFGPAPPPNVQGGALAPVYPLGPAADLRFRLNAPPPGAMFAFQNGFPLGQPPDFWNRFPAFPAFLAPQGTRQPLPAAGHELVPGMPVTHGLYVPQPQQPAVQPPVLVSPSVARRDRLDRRGAAPAANIEPAAAAQRRRRA